MKALQKVFICKELSDLEYFSKKAFPNSITYFCSETSFEEFSRLHRKKLIRDPKCKIFLEVDSYKSENILSLLKSADTLDKVVWCFSSLAKNTKLYKEICDLCSIENIKPISYKKDKLEFIKSLMDRYSIGEDSLYSLYNRTSDLRTEIEKEVLKLKQIEDTCSSLKGTEITVASSKTDVFDFLDAVYSNNQQAAQFLSTKIEQSTNDFQIHSLFTKKNFYFMNLAIDNTNEARKFWASGDYFLRQDQQFSKRKGFEFFVLFQRFLDDLFFGDMFLQRPFSAKVCRILHYMA